MELLIKLGIKRNELFRNLLAKQTFGLARCGWNYSSVTFFDCFNLFKIFKNGIKSVTRVIVVKNTLADKQPVNQSIQISFNHKFKAKYSCYTNLSPIYGNSIVYILIGK